VPSLCQGRIVWTEIADKNGKNKYYRPFIILTPDDEIEDADELFGVVASHTAANLKPPPPYTVALPWQPNGRVGTKLRKPTLALCGWVEHIRPSDVAPENIGGIVPPTIIELILDNRASIPPGFSY
jgi:hypothetical protein